MKKIGLFFGSFNPVHIGHLIVANYFTENTPLDEVWWMVSPQSPFKQKKELLDGKERLEMVARVLANFPKLKPCSIEFELPTPNYTVDTLVHMSAKFLDCKFSLIMGMDNFLTFSQWKDYEAILKSYPIYIYPRKYKGKVPNLFSPHSTVTLIDAPEIEISASFIREQIRNKKEVRPLLPVESWQYINEKKLYI